MVKQSTWNGNNVPSSVCTRMPEDDDKTETTKTDQHISTGIGEIIYINVKRLYDNYSYL